MHARSLASISTRMYRKIYTDPCAGEEGTEGCRRWQIGGEWATVVEARVVFEKGEPRHISLQTNNF